MIIDDDGRILRIGGDSDHPLRGEAVRLSERYNNEVALYVTRDGRIEPDVEGVRRFLVRSAVKRYQRVAGNPLLESFDTQEAARIARGMKADADAATDVETLEQVFNDAMGRLRQYEP